MTVSYIQTTNRNFISPTEDDAEDIKEEAKNGADDVVIGVVDRQPS